MLTVYAFTDFRKFLHGYYLAQKKRDARFSYAQFAAKARLNSPNYLKLIVDGTRNLTVENIYAVARALELSGPEHRYFEALVLANQAKSLAERRYYRERLKDLRGQGNPAVERMAPQKVMASPDIPALLVSAMDRDFEGAVEFAQREAGVPAERARAGMEHLLKVGVLSPRGPDGKLEVIARHTVFGDPKARHEQQRQFIAKGLDELPGVFNRHYADREGRFLSLLLTADPDRLEEIFLAMRQAAERVADQVDPQDPSTAALFRLQVQVYRSARAITPVAESPRRAGRAE